MSASENVPEPRGQHMYLQIDGTVYNFQVTHFLQAC